MKEQVYKEFQGVGLSNHKSGFMQQANVQGFIIAVRYIKELIRGQLLTQIGHMTINQSIKNKYILLPNNKNTSVSITVLQ